MSTKRIQRPRTPMPRRFLVKKQTGVALLTVMFIMALMMTLAAYMVEEQHLTIRRAQNSLQSEFAYQAALAGEQLALAVLRDDLNQDHKDFLVDNNNKPVNDHLKENWATFEKPATPIDFELGPIQGDKKDEDQALSIKIIDESAKFNLNNLFTPELPNPPPGDQWSVAWREGFSYLLEALDLDPGLSTAVFEWVDPDDQIKNAGEFAAEDNDYLLEDPPYRTANRLMEDVSELALIKGFDEEVIEKLRPYVTVLPSYGSRVNINTCEPELLQILYEYYPGAAGGQNIGNPVDSGMADSIINAMDRTSANGTVDFKQKFDANLPKAIHETQRAFFGEKSSYFTIISQIKVGDISYGVESLVKRIWLAEPQPIFRHPDIDKLKDIAQASGTTDRAYITVIKRRRTIS